MSDYDVAEVSNTGKSSLSGIVGVGTTGENKQQGDSEVRASVYQHCIVHLSNRCGVTSE